MNKRTAYEKRFELAHGMKRTAWRRRHQEGYKEKAKEWDKEYYKRKVQDGFKLKWVKVI